MAGAARRAARRSPRPDPATASALGSYRDRRHIPACVLLHHAGSPTEIVAYAFGVLVLTGAAMYARVAIAVRANMRSTQTSWWPGMAFGLGTGAIGLPWAPLPVVKTSTSPPECTSLLRSPSLHCPACSLWNRPGWVSRSPSHSRSWPSSWPVRRCYRSSHSTERTSAKQASPPQPESSEGILIALGII